MMHTMMIRTVSSKELVTPETTGGQQESRAPEPTVKVVKLHDMFSECMYIMYVYHTHTYIH